MEVVLDGVEPALALAGKVEREMPRVGDPRLGTLGEEQERPRAVERRDTQPVLHRRHVHPPAVAARGGVIVPIVDERPELE